MMSSIAVQCQQQGALSQAISTTATTTTTTIATTTTRQASYLCTSMTPTWGQQLALGVSHILQSFQFIELFFSAKTSSNTKKEMC